MLEVFTIGGGDYLVNTFNAVAAWSGGGGYKSLIRVVMVMGLIYSLLVVAFTLNWRAWFNWFLQATLIYLCLMVPTVSIKVTDRINPSLAPATIDNVPLGLGMLASVTTQMGDWLTRTAETVFVMPNELNYSSNGMIYGARLFDATRNFAIRDTEFATNLQNHFKNCTFGDLMLYQKSLTNLANATDLWTAIGPGSEARAQEWVVRTGSDATSPDTSSIVTCKDAYDMLSAQWDEMLNAQAVLWGKQVYPKLDNAAAAAKLRADIPVVNTAFTGSPNDYSGTMKQNTAIAAFMQARDAMAGGAGSAAIDSFATTRADIQARNTYNSIAQQAMTWVPILNIVLTVVFFAMFPVIFPLFLLPQTGISTLKGYVTGFFYLAAWGPLYVVLHMICMSRAESAVAGVANGGSTLASYAGIGAVNGETATIAGFMLMSVPFLAAGLARGAMSIAGQATSMLAPAQNAAEAAALEETTGNYSYGNVSWANQTSNMRQSDQWSTAPSFGAGAAMSSFRTDNGTAINAFGNGQEVIDTSGAISRLPFTPTMSAGAVAERRELASEARRRALAYENAASEILTATHTNRSAFGTSSESASGWDAGRGHTSGTSVENSDRRSTTSSDGVENRSSVGSSQTVRDSHDRSAITSDSIGGSLNAGPTPSGGGGRRGNGATDRGLRGLLPSLSATISKTGAQQDQLQHSNNRSESRDDANTASDSVRHEHSGGTSASTSVGTYDREGSFSRASRSSTSSSGTDDALSRARSYSETARKLEELSRQLSSDASWAENHGLQMSTNMSQELATWYRQQQATNPNLGAPEIWATDVTAQQGLVRDQMIQRWMSEKREAIYNEIRGEIEGPALVDVHHTGLSSAADVKAAYHPHGVSGIPAASTGGHPSAAAEIIRSGGARLEADEQAARAGRTASLQGGERVQSETNAEMERGFFLDPELRK